MIETIEFLGQPARRLRASDGAQATMLLHGAQVVSWIPAGGVEQLYLSPDAVVEDGRAVRGGIPVIFPQFEQRGPLPRHGLARTRSWQWIEGIQRGAVVMGVMQMTDDEKSRALWPQEFEAELCVSVCGNQLDLELAVVNRGISQFEFTTALHTYLQCGDLLKTRLAGLYGARYLDSLTGLEQRQEMDPISFVGEVDRIYFDAAEPVIVTSPNGRLNIESAGFDDLVVWNPGPDKGASIADLPAQGWRHLLCVEAACIGRPVRLAPGSEWSARQSLQAA